MDDDISQLLREMRDISVSFTPEDLIQNMASIGHIKTTETIPHSLIDQEEKKKVNFQTGKINVLFTIDIGTVQSGETRFLISYLMSAALDLLNKFSSSM
jgi:hypothetical protein